MLPNFVVIGAQKAGSTYLLQCLAEHPDVYMYPHEDPYFQDPDYERTAPDEFARRYRAGEGKTAVGLKRPNYLASPECPARLASDLPQVRLIAILRNPVDRAVSAYFHTMQSAAIPIRPLNEGIGDILEGVTQRAHPAASYILDYGLYARHLRRYLEHFERDRILILLYDDLKPDPMPMIQRTYRFLGVDDEYVPAGSLGARPMASVTSLPRLRLQKLVRPLFVRTEDDRTRTHTRRVFGPPLRKAYNGFDRHVLGRLFPNERPQLDPPLRARLIERFRPDIEDLARLLDCSLDHWVV